jgi:hypothetical protein
MDILPNEMLQNILIYLSYQEIWSMRRVNIRFQKNCEKAFACKLLAFNSHTPILNLHLIIVNSRGSPWFHLVNPEETEGNSSIEDQIKIPLFVRSVDFSKKILELSHIPKSKMQQNNIISLERRSYLSRFEWCLKGLFSPIIPKQKIKKSSSAFTLVSVDTDIIGDQTDPSKKNEISLTTYEMQMFFCLDQIPTMPDNLQSLLNVEISKIRMSYSYLFSVLSEINSNTQRISVFDPLKIAHLKSKSMISNLRWDEKYWNFDLVLHWLLDGKHDDVHYVIDFLKEHEKYSAKTERKQKSRYYSIPQH